MYDDGVMEAAHNNMSGPEFEPRVEALARVLQARGEYLVTAESCTGGWIAKLCTDLPGSSAWFERGLVTYSNAAKMDLLGVPPDLLDRCGAVSGEVVAAMAAGALIASQANCALAVSGVAGPDGGTADKPVGTVWLGWCLRGATPQTRRHLFAGDRGTVRAAAVAAALDGLLQLLRPDA